MPSSNEPSKPFGKPSAARTKESPLLGQEQLDLACKEALKQVDLNQQQHPRKFPQTPDEEALSHLIAGLPLRLVSFCDEPGMRHAVLQVPPWFALPQGPVRLDAPVVTGFGRGSRQLGVPTANMSTSVLGPALLSTLPRGVYYGWARLEGDHVPRKAVLNVGVCPTFSAAQPAERTKAAPIPR